VREKPAFSENAMSARPYIVSVAVLLILLSAWLWWRSGEDSGASADAAASKVIEVRKATRGSGNADPSEGGDEVVGASRESPRAHLLRYLDAFRKLQSDRDAGRLTKEESIAELNKLMDRVHGETWASPALLVEAIGFLREFDLTDRAVYNFWFAVSPRQHEAMLDKDVARAILDLYRSSDSADQRMRAAVFFASQSHRRDLAAAELLFTPEEIRLLLCDIHSRGNVAESGILLWGMTHYARHYEEFRELLIAIGLDPGKPDKVREGAFQAIWGSKGILGEEQRTHLASLLALDANPELRARGIAFLGSRPDGQELLLAAVNDPSEAVRASAITGIAQGSEQDRLEVLEQTLENDPSSDVRKAALTGLTLSSIDPTQVDAVYELANRTLCRDADNGVKLRAVRLMYYLARDASSDSDSLNRMLAAQRTVQAQPKDFQRLLANDIETNFRREIGDLYEDPMFQEFLRSLKE
jgi:hypothetical protein